MLTEIAISSCVFGAYKYLTNPKTKLKKVIEDVAEMNYLNFKILDITEGKHGYSVVVSLYVTPFDKIMGLQKHLEGAIGSKLHIAQNDNIKTATINVITNKLTDNTRFESVILKDQFEIYFGLSHLREELKVSMFKFPHVLVSGQTGSGKSEIIRMAIANLIKNFSDREVQFYFSDLSGMNDFDIFQKCSNTKGYARNIEESEKLFNYLFHIYEKRLSIFSNKNCKNIKEYNKEHQDKKMSTIYLVLDEFADYFPTSRYEKEYRTKMKCYNLLRHMVRKFRKVGIFLIIGIQRPDTTILDPSLKSGLCTKIGFSQNNAPSSLVVADTEELANIANREGLFMYGNQRIPFHSLYINNKMIRGLIKMQYDYRSNRIYNKFLDPPKSTKKTLVETNNKIQENKRSKGRIKLVSN